MSVPRAQGCRYAGSTPHDAGAADEIAEVFPVLTFGGISGEQAVELAEDSGLVDILAIEGIEALTTAVGAKAQIVPADCAANQTDFAEIGA
jgi:sulfur carrier protein ThiS